MLTKMKFRKEMEETLAASHASAAERGDVVFKLLTPEEADGIGGGADGGYCQTIGTGGYSQSGGSFTQNGGQYGQSGGTYNMTCPQPSGPR